MKMILVALLLGISSSIPIAIIMMSTEYPDDVALETLSLKEGQVREVVLEGDRYELWGDGRYTELGTIKVIDNDKAVCFEATPNEGSSTISWESYEGGSDPSGYRPSNYTYEGEVFTKFGTFEVERGTYFFKSSVSQTIYITEPLSTWVDLVLGLYIVVALVGMLMIFMLLGYTKKK